MWSTRRRRSRRARESFDLLLRVGLVPVSDLLGKGLEVRLARVRLSTNVTQPAFSGAGWDAAERRVKDPGAEGVLRVREDEGPREGSFEGFECRWQSVPSFRDHKLALLVAAVPGDADADLASYRNVCNKITEIYGEISSCHPLRADRMRLSFSPRQLGHEWRVRSGRSNLWGRVRYFARMLLLNLAGVYLFARKMDTRAVRWSRYRDELVENTDFRKFDGMLRMVMDGSDGGYAMAARGLKAQLGSPGA
jgi:hypothetical protein